MGHVVQGGAGQATGPPGDDPRRHSRRGARPDHQQGLRLGTQGGHARRPGHQGRRRPVRRGGRHGVDVRRRRTTCTACATGIKVGNQTHGRRDDPRRPLGLLRRQSHGGLRRVHRHQGRRLARGPGPVRASRVTRRRSRPSRRESSRRRSCRWRSPGRKGPTVVDTDESPRKDTTLEALAKLKPVFQKDGTVTAGNAPGLNDGASALVVTSLAFAKAHGLKPLARVTGYATGGGEPEGSLLRADPRRAEPDEEDRHDDRRLRPDRGQRGLRGAGAGRRPRARLGLGVGSTSTAARWRSATRSAPAAPACSPPCSTPCRIAASGRASQPSVSAAAMPWRSAWRQCDQSD